MRGFVPRCLSVRLPQAMPPPWPGCTSTAGAPPMPVSCPLTILPISPMRDASNSGGTSYLPLPPRAVYMWPRRPRERLSGLPLEDPSAAVILIYRGELYAIYLLAPSQRQGLGRRLTMAVVQRLLQCGLPSMLVWVLAANPGRAFYAALGGQQVYEKTAIIGAAPLLEVAYGWLDFHELVQRLQFSDTLG